ncbi:APH(3'') family aminoglycoside O-phosphotransferase [Pseudomonas sp. GD03944]|uniref:APH(3'') family aminoglycoside O-phosphotransferase n=1 Tax=Pseudomonas sp. GD03944 TaxID=2975409 RepID=UPI002449ACB3|nr:APH(3'') family aminoglycoside O-phosphotransferase [Pseudomonas sp. GD03944]MDH1264972.1 APH(3'') family aminoglycoside O-phosphotransferase [Pseudomonas sp. GD03944]
MLPSPPDGVRWVPVSHGESGDAVYRRSDGAAFAKVARGTAVAELRAEHLRTLWLTGQGVGSPDVLGWIDAEDHACLVLSALEGVPASELNATELLQAWPSMVDRLKALHGLPVATCPFERGLAGTWSRAESVVARDAVNIEFLDDEHRGTPPARLLDALRTELPLRLAQEADDQVVCHGDACLPNFLIDPQTLRCVGLVDLSRLGRADRHVDLSLLLANARESWATHEQAQEARRLTVELLGLSVADDSRLSFYLRLDPLTWG